MRKILLFTLTFLIVQSCSSGEEKQLVTIGNKYSLSIPSFLTKVNNLNNDASLQYQHAWKEFYVIVIDESKNEMENALIENDLTEIYENNINGYSKMILEVFEQNLSDLSKSKIVDTTINKMPAKIIKASGTTEGIDIFYSIGIYEGKAKYYQVWTWTLESKKYRHQSKMNNILYTLQELKEH